MICPYVIHEFTNQVHAALWVASSNHRDDTSVLKYLHHLVPWERDGYKVIEFEYVTSKDFFTRGQFWPSGVCVCVWLTILSARLLVPLQAKITKFRPKVQNILVKILLIIVVVIVVVVIISIIIVIQSNQSTIHPSIHPNTQSMNQ